EPGAALARAANEAFVDGMSAAAVAGSVVVLVAAVAAWFLLPEGQDVPPGAVPGGSPEESAAGEVIDEGIVEPSPVHWTGSVEVHGGGGGPGGQQGADLHAVEGVHERRGPHVPDGPRERVGVAVAGAAREQHGPV